MRGRRAGNAAIPLAYQDHLRFAQLESEARHSRPQCQQPAPHNSRKSYLATLGDFMSDFSGLSAAHIALDSPL